MKRAVTEKYNLSVLYPELAKEWDYKKNYPLRPEDVSPYSDKKVWWIDKKGHSYDMVVRFRSRGQNCPYCSGHRACKDNSLLALNPKLAEELDCKNNGELTPENVTCGSHKIINWKCKICGGIWPASVNTRSRGHGCPYCSGRKVCISNCLATKYPELIKEWHSTKNGTLTPYDIMPNSNKKVWWLDDKGHEYLSLICDRSQGHGCPYCSGQKVCIDNCLATVNPKLTLEWHPTKNGKLTPYDVTISSGIKIWWIDNRGHEWLATINDRSRNGCPYCSGQKVCIDNCLATVNLKLASEWHPTKNGKLTPYDVVQWSSKKVWWLCANGHEYEATVKSRTAGNGCPFCDRIILNNGIICDSIPEAYYYLKLKNENTYFDHHVSIVGLGRCVCDFYISSANKYIEVTSYSKQWEHWKIYYKNILKKKKYITKTLKAKFEFIQLKLTTKQKQYVRENSK